MREAPFRILGAELSLHLAVQRLALRVQVITAPENMSPRHKRPETPLKPRPRLGRQKCSPSCSSEAAGPFLDPSFRIERRPSPRPETGPRPGREVACSTDKGVHAGGPGSIHPLPCLVPGALLRVFP